MKRKRVQNKSEAFYRSSECGSLPATGQGFILRVDSAGDMAVTLTIIIVG